MLDGKVKCLKKRAVISYSVLTINAYITDMLISNIPNLAWPNYYRSLVNRILDNKALYVYKTWEWVSDIKSKFTQSFLEMSFFFLQTVNKCNTYKSAKACWGYWFIEPRKKLIVLTNTLWSSVIVINDRLDAMSRKGAFTQWKYICIAYLPCFLLFNHLQNKSYTFTCNG